MFRKTITILSLVGLLLSLAVWGLSYFRIHYHPWTRMHRILLRNGGIECNWPPRLYSSELLAQAKTVMFRIRRPGPAPKIGPIHAVRIDGEPILLFEPGFRVLGFRLRKTHWRPLYESTGTRTLFVPAYMPLLFFTSILAYLRLPYHRCRKRKMLGLCVKCGYGLRGSTDRCPECNTPIEET